MARISRPSLLASPITVSDSWLRVSTLTLSQTIPSR